MIVKCFLTREDALIYPSEGEEFRYENGWPFLEIKKNGYTSKLINKNTIVEMEIDEVHEACVAHGLDIRQELKKQNDILNRHGASMPNTE